MVLFFSMLYESFVLKQFQKLSILGTRFVDKISDSKRVLKLKFRPENILNCPKNKKLLWPCR